MKRQNEILIISNVKTMIEEAKKNNSFNLRGFVEQPYKGFDTGSKTIRTMSLGNEDNFYGTLSALEGLDYTEKEKEEICIVLWVFRGLQEDATIRRNDRRLEEALGRKKVPYPYDDDSDEYDEVIEDREIKGDLLEELINVQERSFDEINHNSLIDAINSLTDKQKRIASLILLQGYKAVEVAKKLNISKCTVSITFDRAKKNIEKKMRA